MCYVSGILFHISHFNSLPGSSSHTQLYAEEILNCGWRRLILELVLNASTGYTSLLVLFWFIICLNSTFHVYSFMIGMIYEYCLLSLLTD